MAGELIGALRVSLGLDSAKFETGMKKSRDRAQADSKAIQKSLDSLKGRFDLVAAGIGGSALVAAGRRALDYASSLGEVAQQLGVTAKELQEYRYAASQAGISNDEMDKSLAKLTRTIGEAKAGSKEQASVFRELGVSIQDANGRVYSAGEVIPKLADALSRIKDPATRARLEVDLFGKAGQKLDTLLAGGSKGINDLREAARKLGVVLSDQQIQDADDTADKLSALKQVLEANIADAVTKNSKAILGLANALASLTSQAVAYIAEYPRLAGALGGAAAGSRFGPVGLALGTAGGYAAGDAAANAASDSNMDLKFRMERLKAAKGEMRALEDFEKSGSIFRVRQGDPNARGGGLKARIDEVKKQTALLQQATAAANSKTQGPATSIADGDLPTVAPSGKTKGPTGPTASDRAENFKQELFDLQNEQLGLQQDINTDIRARADMEHARIETERAAYAFDLDTKVKAGQMNAADAERLKIVAARNAELKSTAVNWQLDDELSQQEVSIRREALQTQVDILGDQARLARTTAERRDIELKILDHHIALERLALQAVLAMHSSTQAEKDIAAARLGQLDKIRSGAAAGIEKSNMGPLASYLDGLPKTAAEANEAFEAVAANGIANMVDGLAEASANVLQLKGVAGQLFNQLIQDVIRLNLQSAMGGGGIVSALGRLFGGASSSLSSFAGTIGAQNNAMLGQFAPIKIPGLARGGSFMAGGQGGIDRNVLSINGVPRVKVSNSERITVSPNAGNDNGGHIRVDVVPSPYFDAHVTQQATAVATPIGMRAAAGGAGLAEQRMSRRARNRIPG